MEIYELRINFNPDRLYYCKLFTSEKAARDHYNDLKGKGYDIANGRIIKQTATASGTFEPDALNAMEL